MSNDAPIVLYHSPCIDGLTAAWVAKQRFPDAECIEAMHHKPVPVDLSGRRVYMLDFSYDRATMLKLQAVAASMIVLDHHKGAAEQLEDLPDCVFDMSRSGAGLAWDAFFPNVARPWLVDYVEDRDLWNWRLPRSKEVSAALASFDLTFTTLDQFALSTVEQTATEGAAILRYQEQVVSRAAKDARLIVFEGHEVFAVNSNTMVSELGHHLTKGRAFAVIWRQVGDSKYAYSLRSDEGGVNVSHIAQRYGGNGHPQAAGFSSDRLLF